MATRELPVRRDPPTEPDGELIRWARPGEESVLAALSTPFVSRDLLVRRDLAHLATRRHEFLLAISGGAAVGCVGLAACRRELVVYNLCVAEAVQGRGIGSRLLARVVEVAAEHGYHALLASSRHSGEWFLRHNFREVDLAEAPAEWRGVLRRGRHSRLYLRAIETRTGRTLRGTA